MNMLRSLKPLINNNSFFKYSYGYTRGLTILQSMNIDNIRGNKRCLSTATQSCYRLLEYDNADKLSDAVNQHLQNGWKLFGPVGFVKRPKLIASSYGWENLYVQPIVKDVLDVASCHVHKVFA